MHRPKKISLLCSSFPPETGAAPIRMYHLAKMLQENGFAVEVITAMPNYPSGKIFKAYKGKYLVKEQWENILITRIWFLPTNSSSRLKRSISLLSYSISLLFSGFAALKKSKADLLIISSPPFVCGFLGSWIGKRLAGKTLLNISDLWPQSANELGFLHKGLLYKLLLRAEKKMYQSADAISVQSVEILDHIQIHTLSKPSFIYRNLQPLSPYAEQARPKGKRQIVYAGLLGIAQGVLDIIRHIDFAALDCELHIYGKGFEQEGIQNFITQEPQRGVYYRGSFPANEMPLILANYHAMLIPLSTNIAGAVPSKIFNSMANGLPILFCGSGEAASIIQEKNIGWVAPSKDFEQLKRHLSELIQLGETDYDAMRKRCIHCSREEYNKEKQDAMFLNFILQAI